MELNICHLYPDILNLYGCLLYTSDAADEL